MNYIDNSIHSFPTDIQGTKKIERPLVILPTFNEADNIIQILKAIEVLPVQVSILVVDDSSPDGTAEMVINYPSFGKNIFLLKRPMKSGLGSAYREGYQWALKNGHDICIQMDSDFSHNPNDIPRLLRAVSNGADIAIGSRYLNGISVVNWPLHRLFLSLWAGVYTRFVTRMPLSDPTAGFKAIHGKLLKKLIKDNINSDGYGFLIEIKYFAWKNGFTIKEIPIIFTERRNGQSKLNFSIKVQSAILVMQIGLGRVWDFYANSRFSFIKSSSFKLRGLAHEKKT
ncbi:MAG TPA: polyprenol monophosphomannose synthase [Gammaproteobacteria bacterium]|jgi:dolichol-phosphate mannosyltransferase|nr:polyprenol monophosphomannose synthase [Gammaproteobacteria bacterium]